MIQLSVGMPTYNSEKIVWLAFESLIRQKTDFDWELLIIEEKQNSICNKLIKQYKNELEAANCTNIKYKALDTWIPLSQKYVKFNDIIDEDSKVFVIQAADCFSNPNRLQVAYENIDEHDWIMYKKAMFFEISAQKTILFDWNTQNFHPCGCDMSFKSEYLKLLPLSTKRKGVDGWLYNSMKDKLKHQMKTYWDISDNWKYSINTHGLNNISNRDRFFKNPTVPFVKTNMCAMDYVPINIKKRLTKI